MRKFSLRIILVIIYYTTIFSILFYHNDSYAQDFTKLVEELNRDEKSDQTIISNQETIIDELSTNFTLLLTITAVITSIVTGFTIFGRWLLKKFLNSVDEMLTEHKKQVNQNFVKQDKILIHQNAKMEGITNHLLDIQNNINTAKSDIHNLESKVTEHLIWSATEDSKIKENMKFHKEQIDELRKKNNL